MTKRGRPRTAKQYTPSTAPKPLSVPDIDFGGTFKNQKLAELLSGSANKRAACHGDSSRVAPKLIASPQAIITSLTVEPVASCRPAMRPAKTEIRLAKLLAENPDFQTENT